MRTAGKKVAPMKKAVKKKLAKKRVTAKKKLAKKKAAPKKAEVKTKAGGKKTTGGKSPGALKKQDRGKSQGVDTVAFALEGLGARSGEQSGDLQGLSNVEGADSESVDELLEEGNAFEADVVKGVEDAEDTDEGEVRTHEMRPGFSRCNARPGAVDVLDVVHIQDDLLLSFGDQALQFLTQSIALLAEHDAAVQRHHGHAVHFAVRHLQSHVCFLLIDK